MNDPHTVRFDWERFRLRVERLRKQHAGRTPHEAAAASLAAFKAWGVTPPPSFNDAHPGAVCGGPTGVLLEG